MALQKSHVRTFPVLPTSHTYQHQQSHSQTERDAFELVLILHSWYILTARYHGS